MVCGIKKLQNFNFIAFFGFCYYTATKKKDGTLDIGNFNYNQLVTIQTVTMDTSKQLKFALEDYN